METRSKARSKGKDPEHGKPKDLEQETQKDADGKNRKYL